MYAQLDSSSSQPKSYCVMSQKSKKSRHRRVGSGTFAAAPKYSPCRDRRYQSEPENRKVKLVDTETQTDAMDVSETDISPSAGCPSRDISMVLEQHCLQQENVLNQTMEGLATVQQRINRQQIAEPQTAVNMQQLMEQRLQNQMQYSTSPMTITPTSPNGNSLTTSDLTFQDACSSPDQLLDDVMNSNERLDITDCCSDNENLERLGRKVIELINENRLSMHSNTITANNSNSNSIITSTNNTQCNNTTNTAVSNNQNTNSSGLHQQNPVSPENGNSEGLMMMGRDTTDEAGVELRTPRLSRGSSLHRSSLRQQAVSGGPGGNDMVGNVLNANGVESNEDICEDSWSDEEGEDTDYNYSLRRRR